MAHIGILGGTFNPPHHGHLVCAQEALVQCDLDRVVLMPVGVPPHKVVEDEPGPEHRLEMCRLAVARDERFSVSRMDVDREGPAYTADTLRAIHGIAPGDDLTFIVGGDMARSLPEWREPDAVLAMATLAVAEREGAARREIEGRLAEIDAVERVRFFDMPRVDVSSSVVRDRVREGLPIRYLVPDAVVRYIGSHGLYGSAPAAVAPAGDGSA
jgi:nicotinate-nucleotide adenylyltransferase